MTTEDKVVYAIAGIVVLVVIVTVLDVACMVALDMRLAKVPKRAAIAVGLLSSSPEPAAPAPVKATPTPKPAEETSTPKPKPPTPKPAGETSTPKPKPLTPKPAEETSTPKPKLPTPKPVPATLTPVPPTPTAQLQVKKVKQVWLTEFGTAWVHAAIEITNVGQTAVDLGSITFTVYSTDGRVLETMSLVSPIPEIIRAGEVAYAYEETTLDIAAPAEVGELKVNFDYNPTHEEPQLLSVENLSWSEEKFTGHRVTGEVVNTSGKNADDIRVAVALYDGAGNLLGVFTSYSIGVTLVPGDRVGFEATTLSGFPPAVGATVQRLVAVAYNWTW
jgi:hypothetical protein